MFQQKFRLYNPILVLATFLIAWSASVKVSFLHASTNESLPIEVFAEKANAGPAGDGSMWGLLLSGGQIIWMSYNTYAVRRNALENAFVRTYGYCPSDPYELARRYANSNNSRVWFFWGDWVYFVRN